ncbi:hypothetical protein ACTXG6_40410 [Pseudonocardia sp. Cha107L01]|uniref:hypothetical protein n=1 Tax=Pseudonocardia sp. Cha107L01 TaxID=3457576 RepID=UPI00403EAB91
MTRRKLARIGGDERAERIRQLVDLAPPLTAEQRDKIALLMRPMTPERTALDRVA